MEQTQTERRSREEPLSQLLDELGSGLLSQLAKIMTLLAEGRPVAIQRVADRLLLSEEDAKSWLVDLGAEFDAAGDLIGLGLTSVPTPHAFRVNGHDLYAWCAGDTLLFPAILGMTAQVESSDPISGAKIRFTATPQGARGVEPRTAVLTWPKHADSSDIRGSVCYPSLWFASPETAQSYASKNNGLTVRTPDEFNELLKIVPEKLGAQSTPKKTKAGLSCASASPECR
ncbi:MAG: hypothetical protein KGI38_02240 [Thaumarchaeota archaeon]|nr:hypothetical protein [Nitrososphaerota archaeon]